MNDNEIPVLETNKEAISGQIMSPKIVPNSIHSLSSVNTIHRLPTGSQSSTDTPHPNSGNQPSHNLKVSQQSRPELLQNAPIPGRQYKQNVVIPPIRPDILLGTSSTGKAPTVPMYLLHVIDMTGQTLPKSIPASIMAKTVNADSVLDRVKDRFTGTEGRRQKRPNTHPINQPKRNKMLAADSSGKGGVFDLDNQRLENDRTKMGVTTFRPSTNEIKMTPTIANLPSSAVTDPEKGGSSTSTKSPPQIAPMRSFILTGPSNQQTAKCNVTTKWFIVSHGSNRRTIIKAPSFVTAETVLSLFINSNVVNTSPQIKTNNKPSQRDSLIPIKVETSLTSGTRTPSVNLQSVVRQQQKYAECGLAVDLHCSGKGGHNSTSTPLSSVANGLGSSVVRLTPSDNDVVNKRWNTVKQPGLNSVNVIPNIDECPGKVSSISTANGDKMVDQRQPVISAKRTTRAKQIKKGSKRLSQATELSKYKISLPTVLLKPLKIRSGRGSDIRDLCLSDHDYSLLSLIESLRLNTSEKNQSKCNEVGSYLRSSRTTNVMDDPVTDDGVILSGSSTDLLKSNVETVNNTTSAEPQNAEGRGVDIGNVNQTDRHGDDSCERGSKSLLDITQEEMCSTNADIGVTGGEHNGIPVDLKLLSGKDRIRILRERMRTQEREIEMLLKNKKRKKSVQLLV